MTIAPAAERAMGQRQVGRAPTGMLHPSARAGLLAATAGDGSVAAQTAPAAAAPLDETGEPLPDTIAAARELAKRTELLMIAQHRRDQLQQLRLDRMKSEFDNAQAVRAEFLREMNVLRDMALEQQKKDDEVLKKRIAMI